MSRTNALDSADSSHTPNAGRSSGAGGAESAAPGEGMAPVSSDRLRLRDARAVFRLVNEVRELGADPQKWRPHMVQRLRKLFRAGIVVSSEVHFRKNPKTGTMRVIDIGWASDTDGAVTRIHTERDDESPEAFWLTAGAAAGAPTGGAAGTDTASPVSPDAPPAPQATDADEVVPVHPAPKVYGGTSFILSQVTLPHAAAVDQLGLHREWGDKPFTRAEHRLVRLFHVELGRLWKRDVLRQAEDANSELPPRLAQTLEELLVGSSEKQIAMKLDLSRHTIHNYVKALHQRFGVSSRGELLAKAGAARAEGPPRLSLTLPPQKGRRRKRGAHGAAGNSGEGSGV